MSDSTPAVGADVTALMGSGDVPPVGADVTHLMAPDFHTTNATDEQGNPIVRDASAIWDKANEPLIPQIAEAAHAIADHIDAPKLDRSQTEAQIRGFFSGATEGAGHLLSSFTSPVGLALTLAGLGEDAPLIKSVPALKTLVSLPAVQKVQAAVRGTMGAAMAGEGASRLATGDTLAEKGMGVVEAGAGALGMGSALPVAREALGLDQSITQWRNSRLANATRAAESQHIKDVMAAVPPSSRVPYDPGTVQRVRPYLQAEHAVTPIASVTDLRDAADSAITQIEEHVGQAVAAHPKDLIRSSPLAAAKQALSGSVRASDMATGMKELADLGLDKPVTIEQADAIRLRLNAENKAVLARNNYDVATARQVDPAFAAREAAVASLRDGIYNQLQARGIAGVAQLRRDEGALIQLRNASQRQAFAGDKAVAGTGTNGPTRRVAARLLRMAGTAGGAALGGPVGAVSGAVTGEELGRAIARPNLTRDELVARAFSQPSSERPVYPAIPADADPKALLGSGAVITPPPADTSSVRGVPADVQRRAPAGLLPSPATVTPPPADASFVRGVPAEPVRRDVAGFLQKPATAMGASPDQSGGGTVPARGVVVRDPKTGRFKRIYTSDAAE